MKKTPICKHCKSLDHTSILCWSQPRKPIPRSTKPINKIGKQTTRWISERKYWIKKNPPDQYGYWYCHYCGVPLVEDKDNFALSSGGAMWLTIDHIVPRSSSLKLRYDQSNLVPACRPDNVLKGSQDYVRFVERYYPHLL